MEKNYGDAYNEVLEVLRYIPKEDYNKVPKKLIDLLEQNRNEKNDFVYNIALPFDKQDISKDAKVILAIIFRNCWATEEEKKEICIREKEELEKKEKERQDKYNPDKVFEKREKNIINELKENNYLIVKEKWYSKLFRKIKQIFHF